MALGIGDGGLSSVPVSGEGEEGLDGGLDEDGDGAAEEEAKAAIRPLSVLYNETESQPVNSERNSKDAI